MIVRIVKMSFIKGKETEFLKIFSENKERILNFKGCSHLELLRDKNDDTIFLTYSHWNSEKELENYRNSELFEKVWNKTSLLFSEKAAAWTTEKTY